MEKTKMERDIKAFKKMLDDARKLPKEERNRHALIASKHNCFCLNCFCCACLAIQREEESRESFLRKLKTF